MGRGQAPAAQPSSAYAYYLLAGGNSATGGTDGSGHGCKVMQDTCGRVRIAHGEGHNTGGVFDLRMAESVEGSSLSWLL